MMDALEYERAYVEENASKDLEIPLYTRLATIKTQQYLIDQSSPTTKSFPSMRRQSKNKNVLEIFKNIFIFL
jgi:hypothetical protein